MSDVILINFRNERDMYPPFGIMYVADALLQQGLSVELWHESGESVEDFVRHVERQRPLWVGFSTITGPQLVPTIEASRQVHDLGITTVWGGVHATIMPEDVLREEYVDFVVVNEGEVTAREFTRQLRNGRNWGKVMGLAWKDERGRPVVNMERPFIQNLDDFRLFKILTISRRVGICCLMSRLTCSNRDPTIGPFRSISAGVVRSAAAFATMRS
jgi:radical SAM superfamily enzyme YgiQ (UPF0313 family)